MPIIVKCSFCGELSAPRSGNENTKVPRFCKNCSTPNKRAKVNEENVALGIKPKELPSEKEEVKETEYVEV